MITIIETERTGTITRVIVAVPVIADDTVEEATRLAEHATGLDSIDVIPFTEGNVVEVHLS